MFDKQEVVSMGVERRNDRTEWHSQRAASCGSPGVGRDPCR